MQTHRVTIRELAEKCGYSRSTVARALKGDPATKKETREIVQAWAEKLGYQPDPVLTNIGARAWRRPREMKSNLGYVLASEEQTAPKVDDMILQELERTGVGNGYRIERVDLSLETRRPAAVANGLFHRGIRGLFFSASVSRASLESLPLDRFAVLALGYGNSPMFLDTIRRDTLLLDEELWDKLMERGYRRIGYAHYFHPDRIREDAENLAFYHYVKHRKPLGRKIAVRLAELGPDQPFDYRGWIEKEKLDAVVGFNVGVLVEMRSQGIEVPEEVGFATIRIPFKAATASGYSSGLDVICRDALGQMDKKLRLGHFGLPECPKRILIRPPWVEGETLPDRNRG